MDLNKFDEWYRTDKVTNDYTSVINTAKGNNSSNKGKIISSKENGTSSKGKKLISKLFSL